MKTSEILKKARAVISDEKRWTKGAYARDAEGHLSPVQEAVCFCSIGALVKVRNVEEIPYEQFHSVREFIHNLSYELNRLPLHMYNDLRTTRHQDVLNFFSVAIKEAEGYENS